LKTGSLYVTLLATHGLLIAGLELDNAEVLIHFGVVAFKSYSIADIIGIQIPIVNFRFGYRRGKLPADHDCECSLLHSEVL
jgi:hypothetical protein